jgi:hypothetical protein
LGLDIIFRNFYSFFFKKRRNMPENAISSRAPWSPIFQTLKNSKFKVSKNSKKIS